MASDGKVIELEGVVTALNVLRVLSADMAAVQAAVAQRIGQTPALFRGAPIAIDLTALDGEPGPEGEPGRLVPFPLPPLLQSLRAAGLLPIGVRSEHPERKREVEALGLGLIEGGAATARPRRTRPQQPAQPQAQAQPAAGSTSTREAVAAALRGKPEPEYAGALTLVQPLRAGRIVYAEGRDAIALAAVNAGAELIADGNIHVYAPLRGRALAGAKGNEQARIYCQKLEADLVSVAGVYLSADDLPRDRLGKPAQIYLQDGELVIADLVPK